MQIVANLLILSFIPNYDNRDVIKHRINQNSNEALVKA